MGANAQNKAIRVPGSSTAYPFITVIAQMFSLEHDNDTVIVESTGTGNGLQLFCGGNSDKQPGLASASRAIKESEVERCHEHGVSNILEIKYGYDGIIIANSQHNLQFKLSKKEIFLALAERVPIGQTLVKNPYQKWSDINPSLPNMPIEIYGPPGTSGTRDEFDQIIMEDSCGKMLQYKDSASTCKNMRQDGKYIEIGNNENLIIQKLLKNKQALGIIGYNFYTKNAKLLNAIIIDNVKPNSDNIRDGSYVLSRPLLLYAKNKEKGSDVDPNIKLFLVSLLRDDIIGSKGVLAGKGLVSLKQDEIEAMRQLVAKH